MPTLYSLKEMMRLRTLLTEVETDDDSDFDNEEIEPEEENFSDHEIFSEHDTESEEDGDSENEEENSSEWFSSKDGTQWRKTKFRQNIRTPSKLSQYCVPLTSN
ncbi:hypothetical protein HNY73_011540 [Argiope bruennichi]|uniref:Uncharacterized protein n=1 Tax=Argiope bruennichi TaxID=94029 RepID=A0A8T0F081_ARGBR|nr:hypothetical protein HNY73_011540 [Argiope bruennichi]